MLAVFLKEFRSYFTSAIGYIFIGTFLLITGIFFTMYNLLAASPTYNNTLQSLITIFLFIIPILTMKIISEETKTKTDQLLFTSPLKIRDIILGKYFAAVAIFTISLLITVLYPLILSMFGTVSPSEIFTGYIGMFLLGATLISIGLFVSSLTENQVTSAVISFGVLLFIFLIDSIEQALPSTRISSIIFVLVMVGIFAFGVYFSTKNIYAASGTAVAGIIITIGIYLSKKELFDGMIQKVFQWFSLIKRYDLFSQGILSLNSVVYYLSFIVAFVFLTIRMVDKRRWS
ncbi:ABC transporter permease [Clostridium estertheticum]|uniref:ABC transporter permease n=1 Tax=Clostridium estertheticum TaxID=238834 RepID=A0A5N7IYF1_9CLOT|nr:ABC transporter permease [Clostridium estertheticum]MBU3170736.1 ABC transporter permease [Clostridium estertheticum]MBX4261481.1 ABC transporter permease [Clostridium estertheticum]MCB2339380.1 ABC transporter permease [Clostridium estertheticum]MPQ30820.1 ABC transporter permease [Clostridium estertheticum]MPQ61496.1 ABC transporter permease [Clostridium estertheticum]